MSNRLTFSLASLILIFALAFAAMPAMAEDGGPTVAITEYSGKSDPNDATSDAYEVTRDDFRLKVEFNKSVTGTIAESNFKIGTAGALGERTTTNDGTATSITSITAVTGTDAGKVWVVTLDLTAIDGDFMAGYLSVTLEADTLTGDAAGDATQGKGNQPGMYSSTDLPKFTDWTITPSLDAATYSASKDLKDGKFVAGVAAGAGFTVNFRLNQGSSNLTQPLLTADQIQIRDSDGDAVPTSGTNFVTATLGAVSGATYPLALEFTGAVSAPVTFRVNPNWAAGSTLQVPAAGARTPDSVDPTVDISLIGMVNEAAKTFEVRFTFAKADVSGMDNKTAADLPDMLDADDITLKKMDPSDETKMIEHDAYVVGDIIRTSAGRFVAKVNYRLDPLPVYVGLADSVKVSATTIAGMKPGDDDPKALKVGEDDATPPLAANTPAKPAAPSAMINATNDLVIDVSWTAPDDGGSAITGYTVKKFGSDGMLVKTFPDDDPATTSITGTTYSIGPVPAADRGMSFTFTVTAMNANGSGPESDMSSPAVMIPMAPVVTNSPPVFPEGTMIAPITGRVGLPITTEPLPAAGDADDGDTLTYSLAPMLDGTNGLTFDATDRTITGTPNAAIAGVSYTYTVTDSAMADNSSKSLAPFTITIEANNAPAFPAGTMPVTISATEGIAITPVTLPTATDADMDTVTHKLTPALPADSGLSLRGMVISGTPKDNDTAAGSYIWTARDGLVGSVDATLSVTITVAKTTVPGMPTNLVATPNQGPNTVSLVWTAPTDTGGAAITGYIIKQSGQATATYRATASRFTTPRPLAAGNYLFTVAAVNSRGTGPDSAAVLATINADAPPPTVGAPGAPGNVTATANQGPNTISLAWTAPTDTGGAAITGYIIKQSGQATTTYRATASPFTTPRPLAAGNYLFTVAAMNSAGTGLDSVAVLATIDADAVVGLPGQPTNVRATPNQTANTVSLAWTAPVNTGGAAITSYTIRYSGQASGSYRATASPSTTPRLAPGNYVFTVAAVNSQGTGPASTPVLATINPDAVVGLPPTAQIDSTIFLPAISIPSKGFVVLQRNMVDSGIYDQVNDVEVGLANLDHLFRDRGGIALLGPGTAKDLVFSEIMWGSDSSLADDTHSQWIELYNTTDRGLELSDYRLQFYSAKVGGTGGAIDEVNSINWGSLHGQRGRTRGEDTQGRFSEPVEIISMYRKINYAQVVNHPKRADQLGAVPNGSAHDKWAASTRPSLNIESTWRLATPGAKPRFTVHPASTLRQNVIITEIGNSSEDGYDWVELYNTTDSVINLRKWELSYVSLDGGKGKETSLFRFPDNNLRQLPGKSFLVIASTDPKNSGNDLAAGIDITEKGTDQTRKGLGTWIGGGSNADKNINALYTVIRFSLPNDGVRRNIILRHDQGKMGKASHFEDVVGTLKVELRGPVVSGWTGYDVNNEVSFDTAFWPLHATGAPHGEVINGGKDFRAGRVYQRNDLGKGTRTGLDKHKLSVRGWTGIGYDLDADRNNENGGTPGYHKDSQKSKASEVTVNISEIMIATDEESEAGRVPRATRLPQWIELYNSSMTQGVKIHNWYFEIHNSSLDRDVNLSGTLRLPDVTIPPNQTIMIVSSSGLNSGNFSEARTINLYTDNTYRNILNLRSRGDSVLSSEGFYIELRDHDNNYVDEIGNLGVTRRTGVARRVDDAEVWDIGPDYLNFEGHRTSLIRVYDDRTGMARDGLLKTSWRPAAMTNFREVPSLTYYGNHRDFGTPGYRGGGPLPVRLSKFRPQRLDTGEVVIHWTTESELNNAGFNILRTEKRDGVFQQVNTELIKGHGTTSERNTYTWTDTSAKPNVIYYYQIQDVSLDGQVQTLQISRLKGNVSAVGKVTTTWGELKSLQ